MPSLMNSIDQLARNQQIRHEKTVPLSFGPVIEKQRREIYFLLGVTYKRLTLIRNSQNRASCRNTFNGFIKNNIIISVSASGFTYGGILRLLLNKKLNKLRVHITPNIADNSIRCCSDKWFRGSNSNIST